MAEFKCDYRSAIRIAFANGNSMHRIAWPRGEYVFFEYSKARFIKTFGDGGNDKPWTPTAEDIKARDWEIYL